MGTVLSFLGSIQTSRFGPGAAVCLLIGTCVGLFFWPLETTFRIGLCIGIGTLLWVTCKPLRWTGLLLLGFGLAQWHAHDVMAHTLPGHLDRTSARLTAKVSALPEPSAESARWLMTVLKSDVPVLQGQTLRVNWYVPKEPSDAERAFANRIHAGQVWTFDVELRAPRSLINEGTPDLERSAFTKRIVAVARIRSIESAELIKGPSGIDAWREQMSARIEQQLRNNHSRFVRALALGDTRGIQDEDWTVLRNDGLTHLIAISGSHVGFVGAMFAFLGSLLIRWRPAWFRIVPRPVMLAMLAGLGGLGYAFVTGNEVPTVRTALMMVMVAMALHMRRQITALDTLAMVCMLMVMWDPLAVMTAGFWLSFLGVGWLMCVMPRSKETQAMTFLRTQFVATFALMPIAVLLFGQVSMAGSLANLIAVPWWSGVVVPLALVGTACNAVLDGLGNWAWWLSAKAFGLTWPPFQQLSEWSASMAWLPSLSRTGLVLGCIAAFWLTLPKAMPSRFLAVIALAPMLMPFADRPRRGEVHMTVMDVGQGLAVHVRTAAHDLLYDTGPARPGGRDEGELTVVPHLRARGVHRLDRLIVSHGDNDHAGGVHAVQREIRIDSSWAPQGAEVPSAAPCFRGQHWEWDGVRFEVLWPIQGDAYRANDSSCVVRVVTAQGTLLLTGDIEFESEGELVTLEGNDLRSDLVTVPHHGSLTSSTADFVRLVSPRWALAGTGYRNAFRHPRPEIVARWQRQGSQFVQTASAGALDIRMQNGQWQVRSRRAVRATLWDAENQRQRTMHTLSYRDD